MQSQFEAQKLINDFRVFLDDKDRELKDLTAAQPKKFRFKVHDVHRIIEAGFLPEDNQTEIINGEIIEKMPIGSKHAGTVKRIAEFFRDLTRNTALISVQDPVQLSVFDEPQPDIALLKRRSDFYTKKHPTAADVFLIVEVSDSTLVYDKQTKINLYASAQIAECWIVNLSKNVIEIFTQPENGAYQKNQVVRRNETAQSSVLENLAIGANDILGAED